MKMQATTKKSNEILVLTSYPSRECGIATFSKDLVNALSETVSKSFSMSVCALENGKTDIVYPSEVKYILNSSIPCDYYNLAEKINNDQAIDAILIQHEFGLFGGEYGEWLVSFLIMVNKPILVTFHTVLPNPEEKRKTIVRKIAEIADKVIVMTNNSFTILKDEYDLDQNKIEVIPHGTHSVEHKDKQILKEKFGLGNRTIASTFGLLSSNKNIESALEVMPSLIKNYPDFLYLIVGKTHPEVLKQESESYREFLQEKVIELGLENNVQFINQFQTLEELLEILQMTDVYLFTSKDRNQAVSGTFAYALSSGCPIIATAIPHAKELLCSNTGILIDFNEPEQMENALKCLIENKAMREHMSRNAYHKTKSSEWKNVALTHANLFKKYLPTEKLTYDLPEISLKHVVNLTQDYGMIQFSKLNIPDISSGFTLDDNARALIAVCMDFELSRSLPNLPLIDKYLSFIGFCQQPNGLFLNYIDEFGLQHPQNLHENENLEDANGRAIWALGTLVSYQNLLPQSFVTRAEMYLKNASKNSSLREL
jgi:glycosyltransferase involved in cell wall biosynthesis